MNAHVDPITGTDPSPAPHEILDVLTRMARAMEEQNEILRETKLAICNVSMRIEDLMGCLP